MALVILYRILQTATPTAWDFTSHAERGTRPRTRLSELAEIEWRGVSTYDTIDAASEAARRYRLGTFLAVLDVAEDGSIGIAQSLAFEKRRHFTLWAQAEKLHSMVVATTPVQRKEG
jgi:hypothetical protein